ncbi:MAG TPA: histidine phosphatase family protein [Candidatus Acidoferrum sp.]|nr:histidine phosphatase family protein [Candidatus Acidoferrum sp.]
MIYVARHGETDWNREGRYQGQRESHLTQTGDAQAGALAQALAQERITRVIASPLARCVETAAPLARALGVTVETDRDLIEIAHGSWEGRLRAEIERDDPQTLQQWREHPQLVQFEGGESLHDVAHRWRAFMQRLGDADDVAIVTHDVIVRLAILAALERPLAHLWEAHVTNGAYARFRGRGSWELLDACVDAHLGTLIVDTAAQAL